MDLTALFEAPITNWTIDSDFDQNEAEMISKFTGYEMDGKHFSDVDKRAIRDPGVMQAVNKAFGRTSVKFSLYFWQSTTPNYDPTSFIGHVDDAWIVRKLGEKAATAIKAQQTSDAITIVLTNNLSDEHKITLKSPWAVAHRIAHALMGGKLGSDAGWEVMAMFKRFIRTLVSQAYGTQWPDESTEYGRIFANDYEEIYGKLIGHQLGTMASARKGALVSQYEWFYETFVQYIITGKVTLNPLREVFDELDPDSKLVADPRKRARIQQIWSNFPSKIEKAFDLMLESAKGEVFVC